jgi:2-oxoglutarate ferredoxin oxidoreductase subunit beta
MNYIQEHQARGEVVTGLLYVDPQAEELHSNINTVATPFNKLGEAELCPGSAALAKLNASLR